MCTTKNNLTNLEKVINKEYAEEQFINANAYPIHPVAFSIEDESHLEQISAYANQFLNFIQIPNCTAYTIQDIPELSLTRHTFLLPVSPNQINYQTVQDFIDNDDDSLYNYFSINGSNEDEYTFIDIYTYY